MLVLDLFKFNQTDAYLRANNFSRLNCFENIVKNDAFSQGKQIIQVSHFFPKSFASVALK